MEAKPVLVDARHYVHVQRSLAFEISLRLPNGELRLAASCDSAAKQSAQLKEPTSPLPTFIKTTHLDMAAHHLLCAC